jgi:hypothetical protein
LLRARENYITPNALGRIVTLEKADELQIAAARAKWLSLNRHLALSFCSSMIFFVKPYPLFRIML